MDVDKAKLLEALGAVAREAGAAILAIRAEGFEVETKADLSPVTLADAAAEAVILRALAALAPGVPVVAEEEAAAGRMPDVGDAFFLVDPLDGTKEFVRGGDDFTVNIGLIEGGEPVLGIVYAPVRGTLYAGLVGTGASKDGAAIRVRAAPERIVAVASKSHNTPETDAYLARFDVAERVSVGSSLKLCLVAEGSADLYPRFGPTMEWDTAAGHAVLRAAGGTVFGLDGAPLAYAKERFFNPGFIAIGDLVLPD